MKPYKTALFDFDGVIADTEPVYDIFWNETVKKYGISTPDFAHVIKGQTMPRIMEIYLAGYPEEIKQSIFRESLEYEERMPLPAMPGSLEFIRLLKGNGVQTGLVTSSDQKKTDRAFLSLDMKGLFDTVVTAGRITKGKPDPMCYLLAASDLHISPKDCVVFEDSFAGIQAGTAAGMRVIALATTNPCEALQGKACKVIPDFKNMGIEDYRAMTE
ncbi:Phosphorylated carbohydrates phosphatase [Bacteroidales bacterium Barb6]|nr:Phosphorylated carbohydrates phosphatase [Bacteroidales bacterium Barb6]